MIEYSPLTLIVIYNKETGDSAVIDRNRSTVQIIGSNRSRVLIMGKDQRKGLGRQYGVWLCWITSSFKHLRQLKSYYLRVVHPTVSAEHCDVLG